MPAPVARNRIVRWIDYRLPIFTFINRELNDYPTPRNLSYGGILDPLPASCW